MTRVFVGLSGGVDSAVAAALLVKAGHAVTGVFIKVYEPPGLVCTWRQERRDAMRVAAHLNIPLITLDLAAHYKKTVVDELLAGYKAGRTPNPDILCNREVKFGAFYKWAREKGADFVATGHYVEKKLKAKNYQLTVARDKNKDQSYWLWTLKPEVINHALFPIGDYEKAAVRKLAKKFGLPVAAKKDSQGLCFIGPVDFKKFLRQELGEGAHLYTIGEKVEGKFVIAKDKQLVTADSLEHSPYLAKEVELVETNWLSKINPQKIYQARARYRAPLSPLKVEILKNNRAKITWNPPAGGEPQLAVPGQSLVIYDGGRLVGGGIITTA